MGWRLDARWLSERGFLGQAEPIATVRRVNAVGQRALGQNLIWAVKRRIRRNFAFDPELGAQSTHRLFRGFAERIRVGIEMNGNGLGLDRQFAKFFDGFALPNDQTPTEGLKIFGQRLKRATKKMLAIRPRPRVGIMPVA